MNESGIQLSISVRARLDWGGELESRAVEAGPRPGSSAFELPGPQRPLSRTLLELFPGPAGTAARVVHPDGEVPPLAVTLGGETRVSPLPEPPLAVCVAADGLWVLIRGELSRRDAAGEVRHRQPLDAMTLVAAEGGAVWAVGPRTAWLVGADGRVRAEAEWPGGLDSAGAGETLCRLEKKAPRTLRCLGPDGEAAARPLTPAPGPFERLIGVAGDTVVTQAGAWLRWYGAAALTGEATVQAAGLTAAGRAFLSGRAGSSVELWVEGEEPRELPLPPAAPAEGALRVVAVDGRRSLVYGLDFAARYEGERIEEILPAVDDGVFRSAIFPQMWSLGGPRFATADPQGRALLSASGPAGVAVIALSHEPE